MTETQEAGTRARASSPSDAESNLITHSEEHLAWYTYGLTKEVSKRKRLRGWRVIIKALSQPVAGEGITDYTEEGGLIIDRTRHMRTVTARPKGSNVLFDWRGKFDGQDGMFVEFITEAIRLCSFTVPGPEAMAAILDKVVSIRDWISDQEADKEFGTTTERKTIIPAFRVCLQPFQNRPDDHSADQHREKAIKEWETFVPSCTRLFLVDFIFTGRYPHPRLFRSCSLGRSPRYYFTDNALENFDGGFNGNETERKRLRQEIKSSIVCILKHRFQNWWETMPEGDDLSTYLLYRDDGTALMDLILREADDG